MGEDKIVERKRPTSLFDLMRQRHEEMWKRMEDLDSLFFNPSPSLTVINTSDVETFKSSIEKFQQSYPDAKIKASAYVYSTGVSPQMFKYETKDEAPKLKEEVSEMKPKTKPKVKPKAKKK